MINTLVKTKFERNQLPLSFFSLACAFSLLIITYANKEDINVNALYLTYVFLSFFLYGITGAVVFKNDSREKRVRLYAQLPVSPSEVSVARWYFILLSLCIPTLFWGLALWFIADLSFLNFLLYTILYYAHACILVAIISVAIQYTTLVDQIHHRQLKPLIPLGLLALSIFGFLFTLLGDIFIVGRLVINWVMLAILFIIPCVGFVALNIYLANLAFTEETYHWLGTQLKQVADEYCQSKLLAVLEGGYNLEVLGSSVESFLEGLLEGSAE